MATIGEQVNRQNAVEFLAGILAQAGCTQEDAEKASALLVDEVEKNG